MKTLRFPKEARHARFLSNIYENDRKINLIGSRGLFGCALLHFGDAFRFLFPYNGNPFPSKIENQQNS
jgi:hypothetical protein